MATITLPKTKNSEQAADAKTFEAHTQHMAFRNNKNRSTHRSDRDRFIRVKCVIWETFAFVRFLNAMLKEPLLHDCDSSMKNVWFYFRVYPSHSTATR